MPLENVGFACPAKLNLWIRLTNLLLEIGIDLKDNCSLNQILTLIDKETGKSSPNLFDYVTKTFPEPLPWYFDEKNCSKDAVGLKAAVTELFNVARTLYLMADINRIIRESVTTHEEEKTRVEQLRKSFLSGIRPEDLEFDKSSKRSRKLIKEFKVASQITDANSFLNVLEKANALYGEGGGIKLLFSDKPKVRSIEFINPEIREPIIFELSPIILWEDAIPKLKFHLSEFIIFLANNEIDIRNIRKCVFCPKIFWAGKENQESCSTKCGNEYRNKTYRLENKDKVNATRRMSREIKRRKAQRSK